MLFKLEQANLIELQGEHLFSIVALSLLIACVASYTALTMNKRTQINGFFPRNFWLSLGAIVMGFGIWSMHFIGMSAFSLPISMEYDYLLTVISVFPAMLASFLAFYIANKPKSSIWSYIVAGIVMGLGISTMHYVGMAAMKMDAVFIYDIWLFLASIIISILVSFAALFTFSTLQRYMENFFIQLITAIVLGLAVSSMHYTGMMGISFYVPENYLFPTMEVNHGGTAFIAISVTIGMLLLLSLLFLSSLFDRYVKYRMVYFDSLTGLPNRRQFERRLASMTTSQTLAIWHMHNLEKINQEKGYLFGDEVAQRIGNIMVSLKPSLTDVYRIDLNRFAFLTRRMDGELSFQTAMDRISKALQQTYFVQREEVLLPAVCALHIGNEEKEPSEIYSNIIAVLNHPTIEYKHEVIPFDPIIHTHTFEREIITDIGRAMVEDELYLTYQPKIDGRTNEIIGVEALLRWQHPTYGMLSPAVFIPVLEENNLMLDVTDWVIEQACRQISIWKDENKSFGQVAINIPGEYVSSSRLLKVLKRTLTTYNLTPEMLELEITETSFVKMIDEAVRAVNVFRQEGFSVALDDFGTGVSSLSYLKQMPISTLKIDKSFIDEVPKSEKDSSIIQAIIALGSSLNLSIVFEGVETKEQAEFLASTCERPIFQGFYFAKPMVAAELFTWHQKFQQSLS